MALRVLAALRDGKLMASAAAAISQAITRAIRRLPPLWVRALVMSDLVLACVLPPWAWFTMSRWLGRLLGPIEFARLYGRSVGFVWQHLVHTGEGTGALNVDWHAPAVRGCPREENAAYEPKGSCGSCKNCCTTYWQPPEQRKSCPMLSATGCMIYGGLYWDHFNCGRYPAEPSAVSHYGCPRFVGPSFTFPLPVKLPVVARTTSVSSTERSA